MKPQNDRPAAGPAESITLPDAITPPLAPLLQSGPRQRALDRVAAQLADIVEARRRHIPWQAIAEALQMNRSTLINAVTALIRPAADKRRPTLTRTLPALPDPGTERPAVENRSTEVRAAASPNPAAASGQAAPPVGITPLGRARLEKFNL